MTAIRRFRHEVILTAADALQERYEAGLLGDLDYGLELNAFRLRDSKGLYLFFDPRSLVWFGFEDGKWQSMDDVSGFLEAPDMPQFVSNVALGDIESRLDETKEPLYQASSPLKVMADIFDNISEAFAAGTITSLDARQMVAKQFLIDKMGGFWTLGLASKSWYRFEDMTWQANESGPKEDQLFHLTEQGRHCAKCGEPSEKGNFCSNCGSDQFEEESMPAAVAEALPFFMIIGAPKPPEDITQSWNPPLGFPAELNDSPFACPLCRSEIGSGNRFGRVRNMTDTEVKTNNAAEAEATKCPHCGTLVRPSCKFCTQCGGALA